MIKNIIAALLLSLSAYSCKGQFIFITQFEDKTDRTHPSLYITSDYKAIASRVDTSILLDRVTKNVSVVTKEHYKELCKFIDKESPKDGKNGKYYTFFITIFEGNNKSYGYSIPEVEFSHFLEKLKQFVYKYFTTSEVAPIEKYIDLVNSTLKGG